MELQPYPRPIPYARQSISDADVQAVVQTLRSEFLTQGPKIEAFESAMKELTGAQYAIAVSSGTAALHLSCLGLGIGSGDVGVVPGITFAATGSCLRFVGAEVAFCDVDPVSGLATAQSIEATFQAKPKARVAIPVSYSGAVPDLERIRSAANSQGAFVIEDAAHSIGARYGEDCASASCRHSDAAILSFHPVKHLCSGEGGMVLTNDDTLAKRVRRLRSHGIEKKSEWLYNQAEIGFHYRMTDLQAALGLSQASRFGESLEKRRRIVSRYKVRFKEKPFASRIRIANSDDRSSHHLFVVHFENENLRKAAYDFFHRMNVRVQVHYIPMYRHSVYKDFGFEPLSGVEAFYSGCLSLPLYPDLLEEEQTFVIDCLRQFLSENEGD